MYYVYNKGSDIMVQFNNGEIAGVCNYTQKTMEEIVLPEGQVYEEEQGPAYANALKGLVEFTDPYRGKETTDNWIILFQQPNIKITTDIKLKQEVEPDA